jgi:hypothetical protein
MTGNVMAAYLDLFRRVPTYRHIMAERQVILAAAAAAGSRDTLSMPQPVVYPATISGGGTELEREADNYANVCYAEYYGVEAVVAK